MYRRRAGDIVGVVGVEQAIVASRVDQHFAARQGAFEWPIV